jgi:hypothetical protein
MKNKSENQDLISTLIGKTKIEIKSILGNKDSLTETEKLVLFFVSNDDAYRASLKATFPNKYDQPSEEAESRFKIHIKENRALFNIKLKEVDLTEVFVLLFV